MVDGPSQTDLSEALRDIRGAYEQLTQNNKIEIEGYYKNKVKNIKVVYKVLQKCIHY